METPRFLTPDGRELFPAECSRHHVASERKWYKSTAEKKFRAMGGMILHLANQPHRDLHANVPPPPVPSPDFMRDIYCHARNTDYEDQYDLFRQITNYIGYAAENGRPQRQEEAVPLHENYVAQAAFVELGRLTLIRGQAA